MQTAGSAVLRKS